MDFLLSAGGLKLKGRWHKVGAWFSHYLIGLMFVLSYEYTWRNTHITFAWWSAMLFGVISGLIGIMCWSLIYKSDIHEDVRRRSYYTQLFMGHIVFAMAVWVAFKVFNYDPLSRIGGYLDQM